MTNRASWSCWCCSHAIQPLWPMQVEAYDRSLVIRLHPCTDYAYEYSLPKSTHTAYNPSRSQLQQPCCVLLFPTILAELQPVVSFVCSLFRPFRSSLRTLHVYSLILRSFATDMLHFNYSWRRGSPRRLIVPSSCLGICHISCTTFASSSDAHSLVQLILHTNTPFHLGPKCHLL